MAVNYQEAIEWVCENHDRCVIDEGPNKMIVWENATTPPPSDLAKSLMRLSVSAPTKFFGDIVAKVFRDQSVEVPEETIKEEKLRHATVAKILRETRATVKG